MIRNYTKNRRSFQRAVARHPQHLVQSNFFNLYQMQKSQSKTKAALIGRMWQNGSIQFYLFPALSFFRSIVHSM